MPGLAKGSYPLRSDRHCMPLASWMIFRKGKNAHLHSESESMYYQNSLLKLVPSQYKNVFKWSLLEWRFTRSSAHAHQLCSALALPELPDGVHMFFSD